MRVALQENGREGDEPGFDARSAKPDPRNGHEPLDAMRSWLVSGVQFVDRRRRFGAHGRAKELLVGDRALAPDASQRSADALHRYAVRSGLTELSPEQRRVITLAYLEGRTNKEIATALGVSITTVRRRLWVALGRLDEYLRGSGAWLSALLLAVAIYTLNHSTRFLRWVAAAASSPDKAQWLAATATAGAVATAALGIVAFTSDTPTPSRTSPGAGPSSVAPGVLAAGPWVPSGPAVPLAVAALPTRPGAVPHAGNAADLDAAPAPAIVSRHQTDGCHGNPTSAPPDVPVGPRPGHPTGPPVTHPGPGGCQG